MELKGQRLLRAGRPLAWDMLNDAGVLEACVPGAEAFVAAGDGRYEVTMRAAVGPVRARFKGEIELADVDPLAGYTLRFKGQGGAAGFARGRARVTLSPAGPGETTLSYVAETEIGGKLAQMGSRVIDAAAGAMVDKFFDAFAGELAARNDSRPSGPPVRKGFWPLLKAFFRRLFRSPH